MSATPNINPLKIKGNNLAATDAPDANDDINDGYNVGSVWINVTLNKGYICTQSTAGIAIWKEIGAAGSGTNIANADLTFDANHYANLNAKTWELKDGSNSVIKFTPKGNGGAIATNGSSAVNSSFNVKWDGTSSNIFSVSNGNTIIHTLSYEDYTMKRIDGSTDFFSVNRISANATINLHNTAGTKIFRIDSSAVNSFLHSNFLLKASNNSSSTSGFKITDSSDDSKWDFRNNGDVVVGQDVNFIGDSASVSNLKLYRPANAVNYGAGFDIDLSNSASAQKNYGRFGAQIVTNTSGSEYGKSYVAATKNGTTTIIAEFDSADGLSVLEGGTNSISTSAVPSFIAKSDGTTDGYIQLNCTANTHGIKLKSPPHSASASYTLTFPTSAPSNGQFLKTDGSGNLSWGAGSNNDTNAIHDNESGEISAINLKANVVNADMLLIEDSAASNAKKRTTISDIKTAVASVGTPGIAQSIHSFEIASTTSSTAIANTVYTVKVIPTVLREVTKMSLFVTNYNVGHVATLGIYNNSGTLLTQGSVSITGLGINTSTLGTAVTLAANTEYYFAIWDDGGVINYASKVLFNINILGRAQSGLASSTLPNSIPGSATDKCFWINAF